MSLYRWLALGQLLLLGACNTLPTIVPDLARKPPTVQVEGAAGPLTKAQSQAVLDRLKASGKPTSIFDRHLAFEEAVTGTPLVTGNKVTLLIDGPNTYKAMFAAIQAARDHINLETYILEDDDVGRQFADALIAKQRAGVQVNVMYDSVGTLGTKKEFFQQLRDAGIRTLEYNPVNPLTAKAGWDVNERDHRKLLVVDGRTAFLGGINISSVYEGGSFSKRSGRSSRSVKSGDEDDPLPWRDTHLQIDGPVVADLQRLYLDTWTQQKGEPLPPRKYFPDLPKMGDDVVRAIGSSPKDPYSLIYATLISAIDSAESEILITNAYFVPDPQLMGALKAAVARGVKVSLVLPSKTDSGLVFHAGRASYTELLEAGVRLYERKGALLHSKTALIDGVWSTIGSTNLDWRSFLHNLEVNAVVLGPTFGRQLKVLFDRDLAESSEITLEAWNQRGLGPRVRETLSKAWEYWL
jgi:cardiolipin synthase